MSYSIIKVTSLWSTEKLVKEVEKTINEKSNEGYEIISVSFGVNIWLTPTAYITLKKN